MLQPKDLPPMSDDVLALNGFDKPAQRLAAASKRAQRVITPPDAGEAPQSILNRTLRLYGLPCPPSLNNAYTNGAGHGRRVLTSEARTFKADAARCISFAARADGFAVPAKTPLRLSFVFYFANVQRDGSNAVKLIEDAISEALGFNDRWVTASSWTKHIDKRYPRCDVEVSL